MQIEKPIIKQKTTLGQAFEQMYKESLPIHYWCLQQEKKNKRIKL